MVLHNTCQQAAGGAPGGQEDMRGPSTGCCSRCGMRRRHRKFRSIWILLLNADSSSSSDVSSPLNEEALKQEAILKQKAANKLCAEHLIYNTNAIPPGFTLKGISAIDSASSSQVAPPAKLFKPIVINVSGLQQAQVEEPFVPNGLDLVPWKPVGAVLAMQVYAEFADQCIHEVETGNIN